MRQYSCEDGVLDLALRVCGSFDVVATEASCVHERGERREIGRVRVQTEEVEPSCLQKIGVFL